MDLEDVRRKRVKLFSPSHEAEPVTSTAKQQPSVIDDALFARELAAAFERGEDLADMFNGEPTAPLPISFGKAKPSAISPGLYGANPKPTPMINMHGHPKTSNYDFVPLPMPQPSNRQSKKKKLTHESTSTLVHATEIDQSGTAIAVRDAAKSFKAVSCAHCADLEPCDPQELLKMCGGSYLAFTSYLMDCAACVGKTCFGCGEAVTAAGVAYGNTTSDGSHMTWHCDQGRLALIWYVLGAFDTVAKHNKPSKVATSKNKHQKNKRGRGKKTVASGIGYGGDQYDHYDDYDDFGDYGDYEDFDSNEEALETIVGPGELDVGPKSIGKYPKQLPPGVPPHLVGHNTSLISQALNPRLRDQRCKRAESPPRIDADDEPTAVTMNALAALLPSRDQLVPTDFDNNPPASLAALLQRSSVLDKAAELLHNDSLDDVVRRSDLYEALLAFVRALAGSGKSTAPVLYDRRCTNNAGHDLMKVSFELPTRLKNEPEDTATSLDECMSNLARQSTNLLESVKANQTAFQAEEDQQMIIMCTNISDCAELVRSRVPRRAAKAKSTDQKEKDKDAWQKELAVLPIPDDVILQHSYFAKDAQVLLDAMAPPPRRLAHILKEITTLQTSLPPGIFVRHGESRPDVMKILIVGPRDSPYENGLFEFDLILDLEYPRSPPRMQLKTTGGGTVGFNPNLYACGKVCLSLLNTWSGERWNAGKSTLLQVLVSIQAMIFCEEPYCNEPSREYLGGTSQSASYNRSLHPSVIKYGMIEWLEGKRSLAPSVDPHTGMIWGSGRRLGDEREEAAPKTEKGADLWADVAKRHFDTNQDEIVKTVCDWVNNKRSHEAAKPKPPPEPRTRSSYGILTTPGYVPPFGGRTLGDVQSSSSSSLTGGLLQPSDLQRYRGLVGKLRVAMNEMGSYSPGDVMGPW